MQNVKAEKPKARNAYRAPQLKVYGELTMLTASGKSGTSENACGTPPGSTNCTPQSAYNKT